jgi:hypothetical protein
MMPEKDHDCFKYLWLKQAMHSPLLFNSLLVSCAAYRKVLEGRGETKTSLSRKNKLIKYINSILEDPVKRVSDESIGIVACLTASEVCSFHIVLR